MQNSDIGRVKGRPGFARPQLFGGAQHPEKMQGHWVLARAGKRVLRPGGLALTKLMLRALEIGPAIASLSSPQVSVLLPELPCGANLAPIAASSASLPQQKGLGVDWRQAEQ